MKSTIKKSQLEALVTMITKTLLNEIHNVSEESATSAAAPVNGKLPLNKRIMEGIYPEVTLVMNKMGHIHMWKGKVEIVHVSKCNFETRNGTPADVYIQNEYDVNEILNSLTPDEKEGVTNGYQIVSTNIPDDYFVTDEEALEEISTCAGSGAYNIPAAFSKREGGSAKALAGSKSLGYDLTPQGKQDFNRKPDAML